MDSRSPAVACTVCARTWNSESMAEGLRVLGSCPRCGGELEFAADDTGTSPAGASPAQNHDEVAPHLVLGIPRR